MSNTSDHIVNETVASNFTNSSQFRPLQYSDIVNWTICQFVYSGCLTGMGLFILLAYYRYKRLHTGTNFLLSNVVISNILTELTFALGAIMMLVRFSHPISDAWCSIQNFFLLWFSFCSTMLLSAIAVYQCLSVVSPTLYGRLTKSQLVMAFVLPCWTAPVPVVGMIALGLAGRFSDGIDFAGYCNYDFNQNEVVVYVVTTIFVLLPASVMSACYVVLLYKLLMLRHMVAPESIGVKMEARCQAIPLQGNAERQTRIVLTIFLPSLAFCGLFYTVLILNRLSAGTLYRRDPMTFLWIRMIYHSGSSVIATIFAITSRDFLEGFRYLLYGRKLRPLPRSHARIPGMASTVHVAGYPMEKKAELMSRI